MKNNIKNIIKKKLIDQPLKVLKKINIEKLTKITSLSLSERYKDFKKKIIEKEQNKIELLKLAIELIG